MRVFIVEWSGFIFSGSQPDFKLKLLELLRKRERV